MEGLHVREVDLKERQEKEQQEKERQEAEARLMSLENPVVAGLVAQTAEHVARVFGEWWQCPACGRLWPSAEARDGYGCEDVNCPH